MVTGANCTVSISYVGQKYSLGADYLTATIPLLVTSAPASACPGTVVWSLNFVYQSTVGVGYSTAGPYTVNANLNQSVNFQTQANPPGGGVTGGTGGRIDATAKITIGSQTTYEAATFYVDGTTIPNATID